MKPSTHFKGMPANFWANVKIISQGVGYAKANEVIAPTQKEIEKLYHSLNLDFTELFPGGKPSALGKDVLDYFSFRADALNNQVQSMLMSADEAEQMYRRLSKNIRFAKNCPPQPLNKQKGDKKKKAFFTCMINLLVAKAIRNVSCDYDPRELTFFTRNQHPLRTLSRRVDGAFPSVTNPKAIWEIKEYYYTTTFGSRVADGVYETLLDGAELSELNSNEHKKCFHYLFVDAKYTWWDCGKSYLCRLIDMMHMGYVDEVIFGREIEVRIPEIVKDWDL